MNTTTIIIWAMFVVPALILLSPALYGIFEGGRALYGLLTRRDRDLVRDAAAVRIRRSGGSV
ncbi:MAG: hypothetical protein ABSG43_07430 [Solirubrobacteraceae bacterium]